MDRIRRELFGFLIVMLGFALACGLIDDEDTNITYEEDIALSYDIEEDNYCPDDLDCSEQSAPAPDDQELDPIEIPVDIDVVEETGNEELRDFAGAFRSITITRIEYEVVDNSLTFDLPSTTLYVGPMESKSRDEEGVVEIATVPEVPAETDDSGTASVEEANQSAASDLFQSLEFAAIVYGRPEVKEGQPLPPSGDATLNLTIFVEFTANPQDAT